MLWLGKNVVKRNMGKSGLHILLNGRDGLRESGGKDKNEVGITVIPGDPAAELSSGEIPE